MYRTHHRTMKSLHIEKSSQPDLKVSDFPTYAYVFVLLFLLMASDHCLEAPWAVVADVGSLSAFFGHGEAAGTQ